MAPLGVGVGLGQVQFVEQRRKDGRPVVIHVIEEYSDRCDRHRSRVTDLG